jgi:uncharacterized protein
VIVLLFFAAAIGGGLNAVAGGGSFLTLPALIFAGVSPVVANATSTLALWPASISSTFAYRGDIKTSTRWLVILGLTSVAGGLAGALLLVRTSDSSFLRLLPWLMLIAAATFTFGNKLRPKRALASSGDSHRFEHGGAWHPSMLGIVAIQLVIAAYGGYFGGGMGIMMLATMAISGMTDIHEMNGLKTILAILINCLALGTFIASGLVVWTAGLVMMAGTILGGYAGAAVAKTIDRRFVRYFIILVGWTMTIYFFLR